MLVMWDDAKRETNLRNHPGMDFAVARDRFRWDTALVLPSYPGRDGRARFTATGMLDGRVVTLVFSPLGTEAVSFISLRTASNRERRRYAR